MKNESLLAGSGSKHQKQKLSYGKLLIVAALSAGILHNFSTQLVNPNTISPSLSLFMLGLQMIADFGVTYFLVMWFADKANSDRGGIDDPRSKKVKKIINSIAVAALLLGVLSFILVVAGGSSNEAREEVSIGQHSQTVNGRQEQELGESLITPAASPAIVAANKATATETPKLTMPAYVEKYRPQVGGSKLEIYDQNGDIYCEQINPKEPRSEVIKVADVIYECITKKDMTTDERIFWEQQFASNPDITTRARLANLMWDYYYNDNFDHAAMWAR